MHRVRCAETLDSGDLLSIVHQRQIEAGEHALAVDVNGAGTALPVIATLLCAS